MFSGRVKYRIRHQHFSPAIRDELQKIVSDWKSLDSPDRVDTNVLVDMLTERLADRIKPS